MEELAENLKQKSENIDTKTDQSATPNYAEMCRLCLRIMGMHTEAPEVKTVFSVFEDFMQYCHIAMALANIKIEENDCLPKKLCNDCRMNLIQFYNFKRKCEETDRTLNEIFRANVKPEIEVDCVAMCTTLIDENFDDENKNPNAIEGGDESTDRFDCLSEKNIFDSDNHHTVVGIKIKSKKLKKMRQKKNREDVVGAPKSSIKDKTRKVCEQCGLTFSSNCTLRRHRTTHTGQKDFVCDICDSRFARKFHLDMHMRIHLKIRPHICETCASSFSTSSDLSRHRRIHVDVKNYACVVCERRFKRSSDVIKHMRSHTGQKPYACGACDKKYASHSGLSKHLRRHHPQVVVERVNELIEKKAKEQEIIDQRYEQKPDISVP